MIVGVLFAGEMGSAFGAALVRAGHRVVTTHAGRSEETRQRANAFELAPSIAAVVTQSDVVLSIVDPAGALDVARAVAASTTRSLVFIDANALSRAQMAEVASTFDGTAIRCLDACLIGSARSLARCTLLLAGPDAKASATLFDHVVAVRVLGARSGDASAFKLAFSTLLKGIAALFLEVGLRARADGFLDELLRTYDGELEHVGTFLRQVLPSYATHASRRAAELRTAADELQGLGVEARAVRGASETIARVAAADLSAFRAAPLEEQSLESLLDALAAAGVLSTRSS